MGYRCLALAHAQTDGHHVSLSEAPKPSAPATPSPSLGWSWLTGFVATGILTDASAVSLTETGTSVGGVCQVPCTCEQEQFGQCEPTLYV